MFTAKCFICKEYRREDFNRWIEITVFDPRSGDGNYIVEYSEDGFICNYCFNKLCSNEKIKL